MAQIYTDIVWPGWEVVRKLGEGSFGGVYEIRRTLPDGTVERAALKKLTVPKDNTEIQELLSRSFSKEAICTHYKKQMKELVNEYVLTQELNSCRHVVSCHDVRYTLHNDGIGWDIYIRMELLCPFRQAIDAKYQEMTTLKVGLSLCDALLACQEHNIIHRDIKPENILVSRKGEFKLGDFGIAKVTEKTATGTMTGTAGYMAPEVANRWPYGFAADIYSSGMVMYWMMNERTLPFLPLPPKIPTALQRQEAASRRFAGEVFPPPVNGSRELKEVVMKACAFSVEDRYQSVQEFQRDLFACYRREKEVRSRAEILQELGLPEDSLNDQKDISLEPPAAIPNQKQRTHGATKRKVWPALVVASMLFVLAGIAIFAAKTIPAPSPQPQMIVPSSGPSIEALPIPSTETLPLPLGQTELHTVQTEMPVPEVAASFPLYARKSNNQMREDSLKYSGDASQMPVFGQNIVRGEIQTVTFLSTLANVPEDAWDLSAAMDKSVLGWVTGDAGEYDLFIAGNGGIAAPKICTDLFAGYSNLKRIDFGGCFDTSQTTDLRWMFSWCKNLEKLDLSCFDTSCVTTMKAMFFDCEKLTSINLSGFDTSQVTDMSDMFYFCKRLTDLDLSSFQTARVTNMSFMFCGCGRLQRLDVSSFDTSQVTDMGSMFPLCDDLISLDLSNFDFSKVTAYESFMDSGQKYNGRPWEDLFK